MKPLSKAAKRRLNNQRKAERLASSRTQLKHRLFEALRRIPIVIAETFEGCIYDFEGRRLVRVDGKLALQWYSNGTIVGGVKLVEGTYEVKPATEDVKSLGADVKRRNERSRRLRDLDTRANELASNPIWLAARLERARGKLPAFEAEEFLEGRLHYKLRRLEHPSGERWLQWQTNGTVNGTVMLEVRQSGNFPEVMDELGTKAESGLNVQNPNDGY